MQMVAYIIYVGGGGGGVCVKGQCPQQGSFLSAPSLTQNLERKGVGSP